MFPPGRARLATKPFPTGSLSCVMTMGIVLVASLTGRVAVGPPVTMTSTLRRTSSVARASRRSSFPSACRHSMIMFFPLRTPTRANPAGMPLRERLRVRNGSRQLDNLCVELSSAAAPGPPPHRGPESERLQRVQRSVSYPAYFRFSILRLAQYRF